MASRKEKDRPSIPSTSPSWPCVVSLLVSCPSLLSSFFFSYSFFFFAKQEWSDNHPETKQTKKKLPPSSWRMSPPGWYLTRTHYTGVGSGWEDKKKKTTRKKTGEQDGAILLFPFFPSTQPTEIHASLEMRLGEDPNLSLFQCQQVDFSSIAARLTPSPPLLPLLMGYKKRKEEKKQCETLLPTRCRSLANGHSVVTAASLLPVAPAQSLL